MIFKIRSIYSSILSSLLVLLGFSSCSKSDPVDEYGAPTAKFKLLGKVVSSENPEEPISNIQVVIVPDAAKEQSPYLGDTIHTDLYGRFELGEKYENAFYNKHLLIFEDIDGDKNGSYERKELVLEVARNDFKDGNGWFWGTFEKDFGTIVLTLKENQSETDKE